MGFGRKVDTSAGDPGKTRSCATAGSGSCSGVLGSAGGRARARSVSASRTSSAGCVRGTAACPSNCGSLGAGGMLATTARWVFVSEEPWLRQRGNGVSTASGVGSDAISPRSNSRSALSGGVESTVILVSCLSMAIWPGVSTKDFLTPALSTASKTSDTKGSVHRACAM